MDTTSEGAAALADDTSVARVEADQVRTVQAEPDDPGFAQQWSLPRIGWDQVYGVVDPIGTAKVALLDTGVDASHPDLSANVVPGTSVLDPSSDGTTDPNGHGTWMAGIVAAETGNHIGIAGVGYAGVRVMPVTVLAPDGTGNDSDIISGVIYAADHGADVILMAFSNPGYSASLQAAIDYAWSNGTVIVAATGNEGSSTPTFPAADRGVMGVSSTDFSDSLDPMSNYGADAFLAAPGIGIETTATGGGYTTISGTSAASAEVAGAAALLKASSLFGTNEVIVGRLARNADPAGTPDQTGNGRLNLARAIADPSTEPVTPAGAPPVGEGGPFVGPYVSAAVSISVVFPANSTSLNTAGYNALNGTPGGDIGGTVNFNNSSTSRTIGVSIKRNSDNQYWNGSAFSSASEIFNSVTCPSPCTSNGSITWTYAFAAPADGSYTVRAQGSDSGGSATSSAATFTIDNTGPTTASVTTPANGGLFRAATVPAAFGGSAADNTGGAGLNVNSTTFTLQRPDNQYWTGSAWQAAAFNLGTTHGATTGDTAATWADNVAMPTWASQP
ncbi:MAG TPA: S8 family serine peptidase, partial [Gaiellaceae bacterium]|nr:S8 family serine peptidase [Gaiellaceae bacterium]